MAWTAEARKKAVEKRKAGKTLNQFQKAKLEGRELGHSEETKAKMREASTGRGHTEETKKKISEKALASDHRRLLKSTRLYTKKNGEQVLLDSSWEEALAKRLDELDIEWERPKEPLIWIDSLGRKRKYFPDFYLPQFKKYLDPKNPHAWTVQSEKIQFISEHRSDTIFIRTLNACKEFSL